MSLVQGLFLLATVGVSLCFTVYGQWVFRKYAKPDYQTAVTGCEVARFLLDQAGLHQMEVTPVESPAEGISSESLFVEAPIYKGRDFLSILVAGRMAFLKGQLSNMTFWIRLKWRTAFILRFMIYCGWILFLSGSLFPVIRFFVSLGLGCFMAVILVVLFDLSFERDVAEKTTRLFQRSEMFQANELMHLKKLNQAIAVWGLSLLIREPLEQFRCLRRAYRNPYGI